MWKNFLKMSFRNLIRHKSLAFINIFGLSLGTVCFTAILLFVESEYAYDRFHQHPENVFRVVKDFINDDGSRIPDATTPPALTTALRSDLPEVGFVTRLFPNWGRRNLFQYGEKHFYEMDVIRIDSNFFDVFDFPFVMGAREKPFQGIHSILLTETAARKYFGEESPMGKVIRVNINNGTDYVVTGVLKDVPRNSHFRFDFLIPFESRRNPDIDWDRYTFYTYVRLKDGTDPTRFEANVQDLFKRYQPNSTNQFYIQLLTDIHLKSKLKWELSTNGDLQQVRILLVVAALSILIAVMNYINLVTAQSVKRAKEVGIRKVSGAVKRMLIIQFLVESVITVSVAFLFSFILTSLFLSNTQTILGFDLSFLVVQSKLIWLMPGIALIIGILAGIYPAFYLSSFQPIKTLRGSLSGAKKKIYLRQGLVVSQFTISSVLVVGVLVMTQQLNYMDQKELGFTEENILMLPNVRGGIDPEAMVEDLKKIPAVMSIGRADGILGYRNATNGVSTKNQNDHTALNFIRVDYDFLPTLQIKLKEGRNFSEQFRSDTTAIILNETAVSQLGISEPTIGQQLLWDDENKQTHPVTIIGIVNDFHFTSFHEAIKPFGFILEVNNGSTFFLKISSPDLVLTIREIEKIWTKHYPEKPFEYTFQDEQMKSLHLAEGEFHKLIALFTSLAILIACLGLFGLVAYMAESRTKEIGIRKVLGSTIAGIVGLLSKEFAILILLAFMVAAPFAYLVSDYWLQGFAYHITINWRVFLLAGCFTGVIAFATISFQAIKAAMANPVESLRNE